MNYRKYIIIIIIIIITIVKNSEVLQVGEVGASIFSSVVLCFFSLLAYTLMLFGGYTDSVNSL